MLIVLDTNAFCAEADPEEAVGLLGLLGLAAETGTAVKIPVPCLMEAREVYRRKFFEASEKIEGARQHAIRVADLQIDEATEVAAYEQRLQKFIESHGIQTIGFPDFPDLKTLFEVAAKKQSPFDPTGNNFRDAVIYLAALQFAERVESAALPLLLVTGDKPFRGMAGADERIKPVNLAEATNQLRAKLTKDKAQRRTERADRIAIALRERLDEIAKFATREAEFSIADQLEWTSKLTKIDGFEPREVRSVEPVDVSGRETTFTAEVKGWLHCTVRPSPYATVTLTRRPRKVGETVPEPEGFSNVLTFPDVVTYGQYTNTPLQIFTGDQSLKKATYLVALLLEGRASFSVDGNVEDIRLTRVREKPTEQTDR